MQNINFNLVTLDQADSYVEQFYSEEMDDKIKAAASILYLCFSIENMDEIIRNNESLIGALTRTLREDFKKNLDLSMYLLNIFYAYSNFTEYHAFLV